MLVLQTFIPRETRGQVTSGGPTKSQTWPGLTIYYSTKISFFKVCDRPSYSTRSALSFYPSPIQICYVEEMPAPVKHDLEPYRHFITSLYSQGVTQDQILLQLQEELGIEPSKRVLQRWLVKWNVASVQTQNHPELRSGILVDMIDRLVHREGLYTDQAIVDALAEQGIRSSCTQVRNVRRERGWNLRYRSEVDQQSTWEMTKALYREAIKEDPTRD